MDKITLFHNLVNLAAVDNQFSEEEIRFLINRADRWGIPNEEFEIALVGIREGNYELQIPDSTADRRMMLEEMIRLMAVDGHLAPQEKDFCARASSRMDFTNQEFQQLVDDLIKPDHLAK